MNFLELDSKTREAMLLELDAEQAGGNPFFSAGLLPAGRAEFPRIMRKHIETGNEESLARELAVKGYRRTADARGAQWTPNAWAARIALTEFNTWYVRGLARRLIDEGEVRCMVYRAAPPISGEMGPCCTYEGRIFPVLDVYDGHRARYHPASNPGAFSIPAGPNCHHSIRRIRP